MLDIVFLPSVNKPNAERAAELLGPIVAEIWQRETSNKANSNDVEKEQAPEKQARQPSAA